MAALTAYAAGVGHDEARDVWEDAREHAERAGYARPPPVQRKTLDRAALAALRARVGEAYLEAAKHYGKRGEGQGYYRDAAEWAEGAGAAWDRVRYPFDERGLFSNLRQLYTGWGPYEP